MLYASKPNTSSIAPLDSQGFNVTVQDMEQAYVVLAVCTIMALFLLTTMLEISMLLKPAGYPSKNDSYSALHIVWDCRIRRRG